MNILVATFSSLGDAYAAADKVVVADTLLIELFPLGSQGHLMLESAQSLAGVAQTLKSEFTGALVSCQVIADCRPQVLDAYLSKNLAQPQGSMLIAEGPQLGDLFFLAHEADKAGAGILDLRLLRGASAWAYLILAGDETLLRRLAGAYKGTSRILARPGSAVRDLFMVQP